MKNMTAQAAGFTKGVESDNLLKYFTLLDRQGVAQLVARSVRDAEVGGSSPLTLTK
jgi:hypothetical protein